MTARSSTGFSLAPWMDRGTESSMGDAARRRGAARAGFPVRAGASRLKHRQRRPPKLALYELAVVRLAMKPEFVAGDALLHGDIVDRLVERDDGNIAHAERDEILHRLVILGGIRGEPCLVDQRVHFL